METAGKMKRYECDANRKEIPKALDFIDGCFEERRINRKKRVRPMLVAEEVLEAICANADEGSRLSIEAEGVFGNLKLQYRCAGKPFEVSDIEQKLLFTKEFSKSEEANAVIKNLMEKLFGDKLHISSTKGGVNKITQSVVKSAYSALIITLIALALGILTGLLIQYLLPEQTGKIISDNVFSPVYTVFMNALKMIVAPLVFFSIASSIADFSDLKALGRMAGKIVILYAITSFIAIGVGFMTYNIFPIGNPELKAAVNAGDVASTIEKSENVTISIKDTLVNIVPSDVVTPFMQSNMLQIIFMAVLLGIAAASLSKKSTLLRDMIQTMNKAFSLITGWIVACIPLIVFCSMAKMMISMKLNHLADVFSWVPAVYLGDVIMIGVYCLILLFVGRLNPLRFLKGYHPAMISAFTLSSSNAALPSSIRQCDKLGISEKIYSFSLPLGATINMDGNCITLIITSLFFAKIYGLPVTGNLMLSLVIAVMVLSIGSPGIPGGNLICLTLIVPQIGLPAEAVSLVMGLYPLVGMMQVLTNVTGDAVATSVVARSEGMLDLAKYNK